MTTRGIRAGTVDVTKNLIKKLGSTSEANQWKVHKTGTVVATSSNQIFTVEHGLFYTPFYLAFYRSASRSNWDWNFLGGANYADSTKLSMQLSASGDQMFYIIFKDFGA